MHCLKILGQCTNLNLLYLQYNRIQPADLQINFSKFKNLMKIDLSFNLIKVLPTGEVFKELAGLKILYLHDNLLSQWKDLSSLSFIPNLVHLTLMRNPISQVVGYRHQMVGQMKDLKALDDYIITDEEILNYSAPSALRFRALSSQYMKIYLPKFMENLAADQHLFSLEVDVYRIKRLYERNSPSIRIQCLWRGFFYRSKAIFSYSQKKRAAIKIQKVVRGWLNRLRVKNELKALLKIKGMDYLLMSQAEFVRYRAVTKIEKAMYNYIRKSRKEKLLYYSATLVQKQFRSKMVKHSSFAEALSLDSGDFRIFFLKEQKTEFFKIVKAVLCNKRVPLHVRTGYNLEYLKERVMPDNQYQMIRYPNPLTFQRHDFPLLCLSTPSSKCRVKVNNGLSRLIKGGKTVTNLYTRFAGMEKEKQVLKKLRKIFCHCSDSDARYVRKTTKSYNLRRVFDNYQELLVFNPPQEDLAFYICRQIYYNNLEESNEIFLPFFPKIMDQVSACITIQQSFRSFLIRKEQRQFLHGSKSLIYPVIELTFSQAVIQHRAALCISQWWKYFKLRKRIAALSEINSYLFQIDSPVLYIEETVYANLPNILTNQSKSLVFLEQNLSFDFRQSGPAVQSNKSQDNTMQKNESLLSDGIGPNEDPCYHVVIQNQSDSTKRFTDTAFPKWLLLHIPDFNKHKMSYSAFSMWYNQYLGIIHKAQITNDHDSMSKVRDFNEIVNPYEKKMALNYGLNFISIHCGSESEAKKRALLIGILTYNLRKKSFVHLFTKNTLADVVFLKSLYKIWKEYNLLDADQRLQELLIKSEKNAADLQILRDRQKHQPHNGLMLSEKQRYRVEGQQVLEFEQLRKAGPIGIGFRPHKNQVKKNFYVQTFKDQNNQKESNQLEVNIEYPQIVLNEDGGSVVGLNVTNNSIIQSQNVQDTSIQNESTLKQAKVANKEPISNLKNISLKDIAVPHHQRMSALAAVQDTVSSVPNSVKSVTAYPSSRYHKVQNQQKQENLNTRKSIEFFQMRGQSSMNSPSTMPNSNEQTPMNNLPHLRYSSQNNNSMIENYQQPNNKYNNSAFASKIGSSVYSSQAGQKVSDLQNIQLLEEQKFLQEEQRLKHKELIELDKLSRKFEVAKVKQINQIMKQVVRFEQDANKDMYARFNREEKELMSQLMERDREKQENEMMTKKLRVQRQRELRMIKQEEKDFANNFNQIRNMISKQSQVGQMLKHKLNVTKKNKEKVISVKETKYKELQPLVNTIFDSSSAIKDNPFSKKIEQRQYPKSALHSPRAKILPQVVQSQMNADISYFNNQNIKSQSFVDGDGKLQQYYYQENSQKMFDFGIQKSSMLGNRLLPQANSQRTATAAARTRILHKLSFIEESYPLNLPNDAKPLLR